MARKQSMAEVTLQEDNHKVWAHGQRLDHYGN
jgi:hypothetical protein